MKTTHIQIALFSKNIIERPDILGSSLNDKLNNIFDGIPTIIELPDNAPLDIPIAQYKSISGIYNLNVARNRIDLIIAPDITNNLKPTSVYEQYDSIIKEYCKVIVEQINIIRVGIITMLFKKANDNVKTIYEKYLKDDYKSDYKEISFRVNEQSSIDKTIINNIKMVEAQTLTINKKNIEQPKQDGILIQLDTNNAQINNVLLTYKLIMEIYDSAKKTVSKETDEVL